MQKIRISFIVTAPVEDVFDVFSDHSKFGSLFGSKSIRIKEGDEELDGVGSARRIGFWPIDFDERVLRYKKNRVIDYEVSRGGPFNDHLGQVRFRSVENGTAVDYFIRFKSKIPFTGPLLELGFRSAWAKNSVSIFSKMESDFLAAC